MSSMKTKPCGYQCGQEIFWDDSIKRYCNVTDRKPHMCPNYSKGKTSTTSTTPSSTSTSTSTTTTGKLMMDNSYVYLTGRPMQIKRAYERVSDVVRDAGGKIHGSQRGVDTDQQMDLIVYYEVPKGWRESVEKSIEQFLEAL